MTDQLFHTKDALLPNNSGNYIVNDVTKSKLAVHRKLKATTTVTTVITPWLWQTQSSTISLCSVFNLNNKNVNTLIAVNYRDLPVLVH